MAARRDTTRRPKAQRLTDRLTAAIVASRGGIVVTALLVTLVPLIALAFFSVRITTSALTSEAKARVASTAGVSAVDIEGRMRSLGELVTSFAGRPTLRATLASPSANPALVESHLADLLRTHPGITTTFVATPDGTVLNIVPAAPTIVGNDFSDRDWYRGVTATRDVYISEAYRSAVPGNPIVVAVAAPIWAPGSPGDPPRMVGILVVSDGMRTTQAFTESVLWSHGLHLTVTDQRGVLVASSSGAPSHLISRRSDPLVSAALAGESDVATTGTGHRRSIAAYRPVPNIGWTVIAEVPLSATLASVSTLQKTIFGIAGGLSVVLIAGVAGLYALLRQRSRANAALATQNELEESRRFLASVLEGVDVGVFACDAHGRLTLFNRWLRELVGADADPSLTPEQWAARYRLRDPVSEEILSTERLPLVRALHEGDVDNAEVMFIDYDGRRRYLLTNARALHREDGTLFGAVGAAHDITEARNRLDETVRAAKREHAAAEELRRLDRIKSLFLSRASHELRTPLANIAGNVELLLEEVEDRPAQTRRMLASLERNSKRLTQVVDNLTRWSALASGGDPVLKESVDLREVIAGAREELAEPIDAKSLNVEVAVPDDVPAIVGSKRELQIAVTQLLDNAVKYTPLGGCIEVRVTTEDEGAVISLIDTGPGFTGDEVARVGEPFFRTSASEEHEIQGAGLGLAVTSLIAKRHSGTLEIVSPEGGGTEARLFVSVRPASPNEVDLSGHDR